MFFQVIVFEMNANSVYSAEEEGEYEEEVAPEEE